MRLGLLGGTFDPIHIAHLWMAEHARDALSLDLVLIVPAARPPHKPGLPITPFEARYRMVELAVEGVPGLAASRLEEGAEPSFTIDTLDRVAKLHPGADVWLVIGSDSLRDLPTWRAPEEIVRRARLAVLPRAGLDLPALRQEGLIPTGQIVPGEEESPPVPAGTRVDWLDGPRLHLSSSALRLRVQRGESIRFLVPEPVRVYVESAGLYRDALTGAGEPPR